MTTSDLPARLFDSESEITKRILASCEFRKKQLADLLTKRTPADDLMENGLQISNLLNDLFWTSLSSEEGRSVHGSICICSPEDAPRSRRLVEQIAVSPKSLVMALTASPSTPLGIHMNNGVPAIWGFLDAVPLFTLRIGIAAVGTLVVSDDGVIAVFQRGESLFPLKADKFNLTGLIASSLESYSFPENLSVASLFEEVVFAIHSQRHGGALVITPKTESEEIPDVSLTYRFDKKGTECVSDDVLLIKSLQNQLTDETAIDPRYTHLLKESVSANNRFLRQTLRTIGTLSRIDGAVVMDEGLRILGFGAKLSGSQESFEVEEFDAITSKRTNKPLKDIGGMRHQSAAKYVHKNQHSTVIVASQDGKLSMFAGIHETRNVVVVRGLEHFEWERYWNEER